MTLNLYSTIKTDYPFLAHPPPQKRRPTHRLPSPPSSCSSGPHRRSSTSSAIATWAAHVQPGSPASPSPRSPHRRPSLSKRRRPSVASIRVPSASFLHIEPTPTTARLTTPDIRDFKPDLTTVGYTSVFLRIPNTPISATLSLAIKSPSPNLPTCKPRGFTRFRSLSVLRSRGRSKSVCPDSPTKMKAKAAAASAAIVKRKKAKYAMRPPPLDNELALMQFADGGSVDDNIKRVMRAQAKAAGIAGLADVYRDGKGSIWWDQDEEWEYAHLLSEGDKPRPHGDLQWVTFGGNTTPSATSMQDDERRGSVSTQDSDLDPKYIVQPMDALDRDDLALYGGAIAPLATHVPPTSVLSLPARPRRDAKHLRKPDFLVDVAFSRLRHSLKTPDSPTSAGTSTDTVVVISKPKGKARRRPAPLKLFPPVPALKQPTNSPVDADRARRDFLGSSFEPTVLVPMTPATAVSLSTPAGMRGKLVGNSRMVNTPWRTVNDGLVNLGRKKPSMLNVKGLFRSSRKENVAC